MTKKKTNGHAESNGAAETMPAEAKKVGQTYSMELQVKLDDEKLAAVRSELTTATVERVNKEAEVAYLRDEIKELKETEAKLVGKLERGSEEGQVYCQDYLLPTNEVQTVRTDTGEVVRTRTAETDDLQDDLFPEDGLDEPGEDGAEISEERP